RAGIEGTHGQAVSDGVFRCCRAVVRSPAAPALKRCEDAWVRPDVVVSHSSDRLEHRETDHTAYLHVDPQVTPITSVDPRPGSKPGNTWRRKVPGSLGGKALLGRHLRPDRRRQTLRKVLPCLRAT